MLNRDRLRLSFAATVVAAMHLCDASLWAQPATPAVAAEAATADGGNNTNTDAAEIARLILQLGDERFFVREQAQASLAKLGYEAFDALVVAQDHEDIEIASRAKYLVRLVKIAWTHEGDPPPLRQALEGYDQLEAPARSERIRQLAATTDPPWVAALCRVVRFERSPLLSKQAAVRLIEQTGLAVDAWPARGEWITAQIGVSPRPGAQWLRLYVQAQSDAAAVLAGWDKTLETEEQTLLQYPEDTDNAIVAALVRYQIGLFERTGKTDEIDRAIARLVATESGETGSLVKLVEWLVERKSWNGLDELRQRFSTRFEQESLLAYSLAAARLAQGDSAAAEKLATQAQALNPGDARQHLQLAFQLRGKGWLDWAERELRVVIQIGPGESDEKLTAQYRLADMLHDRMADEEAGKVLQEVVTVLNKAAQAAANRQPQFRELDDDIRRISARMHYYLACHYQQQKDRAKEVEELTAGIKDDPADADVLIALHRLPDQSDEDRAKTAALIDEASAKYKLQIAENRDDPNGYNQLAWLLSNTDREQSLALNMSRHSLKLKPGEPGFLDTLGRCYYALKDYDNAVKFQEQAVAGEPYSGQMKRQLEQFKKALADAGSAKQP